MAELCIIPNNEKYGTEKFVFEHALHSEKEDEKYGEIHLFVYTMILVNPFLANVPILYPLKTPENQRFSDVFRGYKMGTLARNGLIIKVTVIGQRFKYQKENSVHMQQLVRRRRRRWKCNS